MEISDWIQLGMMLLTLIIMMAAIITLIFTVFSFQKQLKLNFFSEYTKRYQEIMLNLPESIYKNDFKYDKLKKDEKKEFLRYMCIYFDLCSEEYHLWTEGHIDQKVWEEWKKGIKYSFSRPAFQQAWDIIKLDKKCYKDFFRFIVKEIQK